MVVTGLLDGVTNDVAHLDVGVGRDLADDKGQPGGDGGLAGDPPERVLGHDGVEDRVRDLVRDFVGVALGDGFRGEEVVAAVHCVPDSQPLRYSACSAVRESMAMCIAANFSRAISRSMSSGTGYTFGCSSRACETRYSALSAWLAKLMSMTAAGCPSAAARFTSRPSPRTKSLRPARSRYSSSEGRMGRPLP